MSRPDIYPKTSLFSVAVLFESGLGVLGVAIAWLGSISLLPLIWPADVTTALGRGLLATVPLLVLLAATLRSQWGPFLRLRARVTSMVRQLFPTPPLWQLIAISLAAGIGEEILFRGALQPLVVRHTTPAAGLLLVSTLFGLVHAASWSYFWLATGIGLYLGGLALWQDEILSAIVVHALYDLVALTCLTRAGKRPIGPDLPNT